MNRQSILFVHKGGIFNRQKCFTASLRRAASTRKVHASSSFTAKAFDNNDDDAATADKRQQQQFMTLLQRFQYFPQAFQNVVRDVRIHFLMQDALTSRPRNQWTTNPPVWVQWKQQRLRKELAWVVPLAGACMLPIVGYIPSLLAFAFPRQMLTRHFWNEYELLYFESQALQRRHYYNQFVWEYWWNHYPDDMERLFHSKSNPHDDEFVNRILDKQHPPEYWKHVSLAAGCFSFFYNDDSTTWKVILPYWKLQARIHLDQLAADDTLLLNASSLQDAEVRQACEARGLPVAVNHHRHALQQYFNQLLDLRKRTPTSDWGLLSLLVSGARQTRSERNL